MKRRNIIISSICAVALTVGLMPNKEAKAFDIENPVIESYRDFGDLYPELNLKSNTLGPVSDSLTIIYNQDYGLEFNLSTNTVEFGDISGIANTELEDCVIATVSSSLPFTISAKGNDFIGTNENDVIPISKLQVKLGNEEYKNLDNSSIELLTDTSGTGKTYPISLNLQATKGYKLDNYRTDLTFTVTQN